MYLGNKIIIDTIKVGSTRLWQVHRLFYILLFLSSTSSAQNLLVNGGFEEENICTEYHVNCAPEGWIYTVPSFIYYFKDKRLANSGSHFISLIGGHSKKNFYRTFVRSRLICGLKSGNTYRLEFFIRSVHPILDSVGVYFSSHDFLFEKRVYKDIQPTFYLVNGNEKPSKDTNWQKIAVDYKANGAERFITFGYFNNTDITGPTGIDRENYFYFLIDDVSLIPLSKNEQLCPDWEKSIDDIYMQDERHEYLDRLIKYKRKQPLEIVRISPTIIKKVDTLVIPDILFESGKDELVRSSYPFLDNILKMMAVNQVDSVVVEGHTDNTGHVQANQVLSRARAEAVTRYLNKADGDQRYISRGWSSEKPVSDNSTPAGRQKNRRVEIYVYFRE